MKIEEYQIILYPSITVLVGIELEIREVYFSGKDPNNGYVFKC